MMVMNKFRVGLGLSKKQDPHILKSQEIDKQLTDENHKLRKRQKLACVTQGRKDSGSRFWRQWQDYSVEANAADTRRRVQQEGAHLFQE
jgi:hypothetical protein